MDDLTRRAKSALKLEGDSLLHLMAQELHITTHGGAPGKPAWRDEVERNLGHVATAVTKDGISMDFGYSPSGLADKVRALIIAYGSGDKAVGGGDKILQGPEGRDVWNDGLTGKHPSGSTITQELPDEFNQLGNLFVSNAMRRAETDYCEMLVKAFDYLPNRVFTEKVRVNPP